MNRALPGPMIDLIRDGVPPADLAARGDRAVFSALVRTAMSACQRGWDCWEWEAEVHDARSHLGQQARLRAGAKPKTPKAVASMLSAAWEAATVKVSENPPKGREDALAAAAHLRDFVADPDSPLSDERRTVLAHAAAVALKNGTDRPALPRRDLQAASGLGLTALRTLLRGLHEDGLLLLVEPGRAGGPGAKRRRAALYRLPTPEALYLYRETRSVVPPAQVCGAPLLDVRGAPAQVCGAPQQPPTAPADEEPSPMVTTLTITATPEALARALASLQADERVKVEPVQQRDLAENVVPMRRDTGTG